MVEFGGGPERLLVRDAVRATVWRLLPVLVLGYGLILLDRSVMQYVSPQVAGGLGLSPFAVGLTTPILFLGILVFEVPSALISARVGARRWLAGLMLVAGLCSVVTAGAAGPVTFFVARTVSSLAQAGFLPVAVYAVARAVPDLYRTRCLMWVVLSALGAAVAGPYVMGALLQLGGLGGVAGWRWLFLCLGAAGVPLAFWLWRVVPDGAAVPGLSAAQVDALGWMRSVEPRVRVTASALEGLLDPRILLLAAMNMGLSLSGFAASGWFGVLMQDPGMPRVLLGVITVLAIVACMLIWCRRTDMTGLLYDNLMVACALATVGYAAAVFNGTVAVKLAGLVAHASTVAVARTMMWSAASRASFSGGGAAALALVDAAGVVATFMAPRVVMGVAQQTGNLQLALVFLTPAVLAAAVLAWLLRMLARAR